MGHSHQNDPIDSALDYQKNLSSFVHDIRAQERAEERAAQQAEQEAQQERAAASQSAARYSSNTTTSTSDLPLLLQKIRSCESSAWRAAVPQCGYDLTKYSYTAYNPTGCEGYGCGGAYQLHAKYASIWAARAGYPGMSSQAQNWPPAIQDAVALYLFYATNPDGYLWCQWASYC